MSVLEVRDLSIRFGGLQALQDVNIEVNEYEIVGLIGPNGAGKTTAFNCITGFYTPNTGQVTYRGKDVTTAPPHVKAAMGFGRTFQNVGMVKSATAMENLKTAQHAKVGYDVLSGLLGSGRSWQVERQLEEKANAILELLGLEGIRDKQVGGQSYGTLKLLELGCALATDPDILLLDEPTSGMGPEESDQLGERLLGLRKEFALTMLVIEHHVPLVLRVCDHVYVLNFGRLLAEGRPEVIQSHPEVVAAYLGGEAPEALAQTKETEADADLEAQLESAVHRGERAGTKRGPGKTSGAKKVPAKKAPAKKVPARKAPARKANPATPQAAPAATKKPARRPAKRAPRQQEESQ
ncbi:MAG TPA: ATP-binding cassette domain-containing protein [Mycobacteriales bacterium]|nr:ATP-binding cassette domain-containing protein [Mycobacteriales bacterium]